MSSEEKLSGFDRVMHWLRISLRIIVPVMIGTCAYLMTTHWVATTKPTLDLRSAKKKKKDVTKKYVLILSNGQCWYGLEKHVILYVDYGIQGASFCTGVMGDVRVGRSLMVSTMRTTKKNLRAVISFLNIKSPCWAIVANGWGGCPKAKIRAKHRPTSKPKVK